MDFRLLGPFTAIGGTGPVELGRRQERLVLAALLLAPGRVVGTERLIALLWPDDPPRAARSTLQTYVGRLRRALAPHGVGIRRRADGYLVELPAGSTVDVEQFRAEVTAAGLTGDPLEQLRHARTALDLWRGEFLAGLLPATQRESLGGELLSQRLTTAERYAARALDTGQHEAVVGLLPLVEAHPARERLAGLLMTALHRCGRRADALRLFGVVAAALTDLGVEVGPDLASLRESVADDDPRLDRPPAPLYAVRVQDQWLPWNAGGHPVLEFCNTYAGWGRERRPGSEWLRSYRTLAVWAGHVDLAGGPAVDRLLREAQAAPPAASDALAEARGFRGRLYACLTDAHDRAAFDAVARVAEAATRHAHYELGDDGLGRWRIAPSAGLRLPLYAVARAAAELLAEPRRFLVRACPGEGCGWLFLDEHGRRRWCSLGTCGVAATCA